MKYILKLTVCLSIFLCIFLVACNDVASTYNDKMIVLPNGEKLDFDLPEQTKKTEKILNIQLGKHKEIMLGNDLVDASLSTAGNSVLVRKDSNKIVIDAVSIGTSKIVLQKDDIDLSILVIVEAAPHQIANSINLSLGKKSFEAVSVPADGKYLEILTSFKNSTNGYKLKLDTDSKLETIVVGESVYVSSVYTGEFSVNIETVVNGKSVETTELKVNFVEPTLELEYVVPNLDNIVVGDEPIELRVIPVNLNLNRVQVVAGAGVKNINEIINYEVEVSPNLKVEMKADKRIIIKILEPGDASITVRTTVEGYLPHIFVRSFSVNPPKTLLNVSQTDIILDRKRSDTVEYELGENSELNLFYDAENINVNMQNNKLIIRGLKLGSGNILLHATEDGKTDNRISLNYKVVDKKLRMSISSENIPNVLSREKSFPISGLPASADVKITVSDPSVVELVVEKNKFKLKPLKDGEFYLDIYAVDNEYEPFYMSKKIKVELPKFTLESNVEKLDLTAGIKERFTLKRENGGTITAKSSDENIAKVQISGASVLVEAVAEGNAVIKFEGEKEGYNSSTLEIPVSVGKRRTTLNVQQSAEVYDGFISSINATTNKDAKFKVSSSGGIEIVRTEFFDGRIRIVYKGNADGNIFISVKSGDFQENSADIPVVFKTKSINADGHDILYMFDEKSSHNVYNHNKIMSNLFSEKPTIVDTVPVTSGLELEELGRLVNEITKGKTSDYAKAKAIYDWVIKNIYYDFDGLEGRAPLNETAYGTYKLRKGICTGYSYLYSDMLRIAGIPTRVVEGQYSYGDETTWMNGTVNSHAWNEAWIDGRWRIIDPTWGTFYKYKNGQYDNSQGIDKSYKYFDASLKNFSVDHRIDRILNSYN